MKDVQLSKQLSLLLRHQPWLYELELDADGWTPVANILEGLRMEYGESKSVSVDDIERVVRNSEKSRFEMEGGRIRALYGHSLPNKIERETKIPPASLYHGTKNDFVSSILEQGLLPMGRQYVHLSVDAETAEILGRRRAKFPVILVIDAEQASANGVAFYRGNEKVWLADRVPGEFIRTRSD